MKKYITLLFIIPLAMACDYLDTKIDIEITKEMIDSDYGRVSQVGQGIYGYIKNGMWELDGNFGAARSDEAVETVSGKAVQRYNNGSWNDVTNPENSLYGDFYKGIRNVWYFLDYSVDYPNMLKRERDIISDNGAAYRRDVDNIRWMRAEAHVALAYYYFELSKRWGDAPLITREVTEKEYFPKTDYDEITKYIVERINFALDSLRVTWRESYNGVEGDRGRDGRFTVGAALALKSRALLYAASPRNNPSNDRIKWDSAARAAKAVIDLGMYSLDSDYSRLFVSNDVLDSPEAIMMWRDGNSNDPEKKNYPIGTQGGNTGVTPSGNLVDAYEYKGTPDPDDPYANRDPRFYATVIYNGSEWNGRSIDIAQPTLPVFDEDGSPVNDENGIQKREDNPDYYLNDGTSRTGYYLRKFLFPNLDLVKNDNGRHVWPLFRYAEVLLNYAEALNELEGPDVIPSGYTMSAKDALNMVRGRASVNMPPVTTSDKDEFRKAVKHERRIELAFEGHRYWDLVRWQDGNVLQEDITGVTATYDGSDYSYTEITVEKRVFDAPKMYFYPFPYEEITRSGGILKQNTGW